MKKYRAQHSAFGGRTSALDELCKFTADVGIFSERIKNFMFIPAFRFYSLGLFLANQGSPTAVELWDETITASASQNTKIEQFDDYMGRRAANASISFDDLSKAVFRQESNSAIRQASLLCLLAYLDAEREVDDTDYHRPVQENSLEPTVRRGASPAVPGHEQHLSKKVGRLSISDHTPVSWEEASDLQRAEMNLKDFHKLFRSEKGAVTALALYQKAKALLNHQDRLFRIKEDQVEPYESAEYHEFFSDDIEDPNVESIFLPVAKVIHQAFQELHYSLDGFRRLFRPWCDKFMSDLQRETGTQFKQVHPERLRHLNKMVSDIKYHFAQTLPNKGIQNICLPDMVRGPHKYKTAIGALKTLNEMASENHLEANDLLDRFYRKFHQLQINPLTLYRVTGLYRPSTHTAGPLQTRLSSQQQPDAHYQGSTQDEKALGMSELIRRNLSIVDHMAKTPFCPGDADDRRCREIMQVNYTNILDGIDNFNDLASQLFAKKMLGKHIHSQIFETTDPSRKWGIIYNAISNNTPLKTAIFLTTIFETDQALFARLNMY